MSWFGLKHELKTFPTADKSSKLSEHNNLLGCQRDIERRVGIGYKSAKCYALYANCIKTLQDKGYKVVKDDKVEDIRGSVFTVSW